MRSREAFAVGLAALAFTAPNAYAQELDVARGTATQVSGPDTTTYELEATSGPLGENATGLITRTFVGPGGQSLAILDVTCLAVEGNRATLIGRPRPESVNVGYQALLVRIYDGTPELQPDGVASGINPLVNGQLTFTDCAAFLPPVPFPTEPITAGDLQVVDSDPPPPPPPSPTGCEGDDDDDQGDGDEDEDDGGDCDDDDD